MRWMVALASAGAVAGVLLGLRGGSHEIATPLSAQASLAPRTILFGDAVPATVRLTGADAAEAQVTAKFAPFTVVSRREHGVQVSFTLRCLGRTCLPHPGTAIQFAPALVRARGETMQLGWPALHVLSRLGPDDLRRPVFRADTTSPPPRSLRIEPRTLGRALAAAAAMLLLGGGATAASFLRPRRRQLAPVDDSAPALTPLELAALRVEQAAEADEPERRRALDELALALENSADGSPLALRARVLAWSESPPYPEPMRDLAAAVRAPTEDE
jgi:hypothetical protein